jgi:hypothetical protein
MKSMPNDEECVGNIATTVGKIKKGRLKFGSHGRDKQGVHSWTEKR